MCNVCKNKIKYEELWWSNEYCSRLSIVRTNLHTHTHAYTYLLGNNLSIYARWQYTFNIFFFFFNIVSIRIYLGSGWLKIILKRKKIQNCTSRTLNTHRTNWWGVKQVNLRPLVFIQTATSNQQTVTSNNNYNYSHRYKHQKSKWYG